MPPKKKRTTAAAKAPAAPIKTPPASPAKPSQSPSPLKSSLHGSATKPHDKDRHQRSPSTHESPSVKRAASSSSAPLRTPERHSSHAPVSPHRRSADGAASPAVPPAPATTPVPVADRTPQRQRMEGAAASQTPRRSASLTSALASAASPVPPPPPPSSPVPTAAAAAASRSASAHLPSSPPPSASKNRKKARSASLQAPSPVKKAPSVEAPKTSTPSPQKEKGNAVVAETAAAASAPTKKPLSRNVKRQRSRHAPTNSIPTASPRVVAGAGAAPSSAMSKSVEHLIKESKVIAPDVSGIRCVAVHPSEQQLIVARENGSLVLYDVSFFQNIPQFVQRRHTGGQTKRTITSLAYVAVPAPAATASVTAASSSSSSAAAQQAVSTRYVLLASMMSGQIVVYDADLLVPIALHQRSGGAVWQMTVVSHACIYAAMADGSWQQLRLTCTRQGQAPQLELVRVVPGISGADRALTVTTSASLRMAVGTDDAGNVHAWRLPANAAATTGQDGDAAAAEKDRSSGAARARGLAEHESLWTTKLAKGIALSCAVVGGTQRPCVMVGTSMGDVVLLDAAHGHVFQTFSQHKGPVTTLAVQGDTVVYASGWHESLRSYRCNGEGDWYPAEVKRRTHYHEASQLALMPQRQLILSASRDGTILYAPTAQLFSAPAMYVVVTTQQFAYAAERGVLLQSRFDTIEAFAMDGASRHWTPFFGHRLDGRFHLSGLWCDASLDYILFSTEERLGLLKVGWNARGAMSIGRIDEVLELPARTGVANVCWAAAEAAGNGSDEEGEEASAAAPSSRPAAARVLHILYDDSITSVTLAEGYPTVHTSVQVRGKALPGDSLRPHSVFCRPASSRSRTSAAASASGAAQELVVYGYQGSCRLQLTADGTPDAATLVADLDDVYSLVQAVPMLRRTQQKLTDAEKGRLQDVDDESNGRAEGGEQPNAKKAKTEASTSGSVFAASSVLVGLSATQQRYIVGSTLHSSVAGATALPATLPHDVRWIARIASTSASSAPESYKYLGYFSRGLLVASGDSWHMVRRMTVEAAFVMKGESEVVVLERNLEKTLEALPLTWKVRRFGN